MKKSQTIIVFAAAINLCTLAMPTVAKPQMAGLTDTQQATLKSLGIKVVIPRYIPQGFQVAKIKTEPCRSKDACRVGQPSYTITYRSPQKVCFDIEGTSGGLGGPELEDAIPVKSKLFGSTQVGSFNMREGSHLSSDWLTVSSPSGSSYRLYSRESKPNGCTSKIMPQEAVKVVQSLEWLEL
jgi:hypothetical protein